ncbi:uncharacterized protein RSE6_02193 [Rhynchosporium secalis]|uniref:RNase H type-1 domain-containing protein n=1 Tax=Rhynchosporium secalis TaxID=38038 RepID=A0A1E1LZQ0_RHYSE|nr:uncharacterized protein RSE6_02193 [Rhynchosporium secalis]
MTISKSHPTQHSRFHPSDHWANSRKHEFDVLDSELEMSSRPPSFIHPACSHASRCRRCGWIQAHANSIVIAVDGACRGNGEANPRSAIGIYFGPDSVLNRSDAVPSEEVDGNLVRATGVGGGYAMYSERDQQILDVEQVIIKSDSEYLVKGMTEWAGDESGNGVGGFGIEVLFWHLRRERNREADRLANAALNG